MVAEFTWFFSSWRLTAQTNISQYREQHKDHTLSAFISIGQEPSSPIPLAPAARWNLDFSNDDIKLSQPTGSWFLQSALLHF
ncbi:unnamed protein product [Thelazia callipaeda]|uniref:Uncharacterized protein n=1 Tax=Thelazia callipaeda TaxID=103827 RepID=A0A0N5D2I5_THECL|nr:unnamed protein product [Thelazia callipaeda]